MSLLAKQCSYFGIGTRNYVIYVNVDSKINFSVILEMTHTYPFINFFIQAILLVSCYFETPKYCDNTDQVSYYGWNQIETSFGSSGK